MYCQEIEIIQVMLFFLEGAVRPLTPPMKMPFVSPCLFCNFFMAPMGQRKFSDFFCFKVYAVLVYLMLIGALCI